MVTSCVAYNCTNRQKKGSSISFHRFPDVKKMPEHRAAWIQAIRRKDWTPTSNSFLCSEHFEENCFVVRPNKIGRRLNDWAVPSIFNFPSHRQSKQKKFRKSKKQLAEATVGSSTVEGQDVPSHAKVTRRSAVEDQDVPSHVKVARRSAVEDQDVQSHTKVARSSIVEDEDVPSHAKVARLSVVEDQDVQSHAKVTQDSIMEDQDVPSHAKVARSNVIEVQDGSSHAKVAKQPDQEESRIARKHPAESSVGCSVVVDEGVPSLAKVAQRLCTEHSYVSQSQPVPPKIIKKTAELKKKIKALNQKLRRKQQRINRLTYLVKSIGDQRLLIEGEHKHDSATKEKKKTDDVHLLLATSHTSKQPGRKKNVSQNFSSIHDIGTSPVFSLRRMVMLFENRDYSGCAMLLNKLSMLTLTTVVEDFPVVTIVDNVPATLGILEVLYSRYFMTDSSITSLQPEYLLDQLIRWMATVGDLRSLLGQNCFGCHLTQVQNTLRIIAFQRRDLGKKLCTEQQQLKQCIVRLQKHRLLKTSMTDNQLLTMDEALRVTFNAQFHQMKRTLRKLEDITFDKEKQRTKSAQTKRSSLKRQLSAQKSVHMTQGEVEERLLWNTMMLNAFEPVQTYMDMARLLQTLHLRVQSDRDILLRCSDLRSKSHSIVRNADIAQILHQVVQAYGKVLSIWSEVTENQVSVSSEDGSVTSSQPRDSIDSSSLNSSMLALVNSDAFSDSTDGGEITTEKASEATETIVEVSTPMGCTQGHEFPDEDELPLPRSLPISAATNGIAIERTTADQYQPFSMPVQATVPPTVDDTELVNLRNEVHVLKKELVRCRDTVVKLNYHEKKLKDRLSEQAQKQFLRGPTKFEDISLGAVRPTELIRSFGNLYTEARVEAFDALDEVPQMAGFDDLKGKLLFSIVVLSFRSVQQEILVIKKKIRDLLHMPETFEDPEEASSDDSLGKMAKELETMMSDYFRRTVHKQDIQKNIEEVSQQMCQTLYDYPGLKDSDGLKLYTEEVVRLAWALSVQNPPLFIVYDFKTFNPEELTRFHSSDPESDEVKAVLWPALQEGMEGAIVHKAVVIT